MSGLVYGLSFNATLTAAGGNADLVLLKPADDEPIRLAGWIWSNNNRFGDAAEQAVRYRILHMTATITDGTGGNSNADVAPSGSNFTHRFNDTTVATTTGTTSVREHGGWNIRNTPWERYIPEEFRRRFRAVQSEGLIVRMENTLTQDVDVSMTFLVEVG